MQQNRSSKSNESSRHLPSSNDNSDDMIRLLGGGELESADRIGKPTKGKKIRQMCPWSEFMPIEKSDKAPCDFTASDLLKMIKEGVQRRFKLFPEIRVKYAYTVLADLREMLQHRFPKENEFALAFEYINWYMSNRSDSDVAKKGRWRLSMLVEPKSIALFCSARDSVDVSILEVGRKQQFVRLPLDEDTLTRRLQQPLENFVEDYGPIIPFAVMQKKENLSEDQAGALVIKATKNLVSQGRASYDSVAKSMVAYGPYPQAVASMGARLFVQNLSNECCFEFSPFLSFVDPHDQG